MSRDDVDARREAIEGRAREAARLLDEMAHLAGLRPGEAMPEARRLRDALVAYLRRCRDPGVSAAPTFPWRPIEYH